MLHNIMSQQEVTQLFAAPLSLKEYCIIGLLYGSGLRTSELAVLCIHDIESALRRIKVMQGKGAKDRYILLADKLLDILPQYFVVAKRPKQFLFTSTQTRKASHPRSMQLVIMDAMKKQALPNYRINSIPQSSSCYR